MKRTVHGVVLAAGLSSRMGSPKQLLPFGTGTLLEAVVDALTGAHLDRVVVVVGHKAAEVRNCLKNREIEIVLNAHYRQGMLSSIQTGVRYAIGKGADGLLLALGDQPHVRLDVTNRVVGTYRETGKGIVIPTFGGRRGHPVLFDLRRYGDEVLAASPDRGLKPVMRGHPDDTVEIPVDDDGVLRDIDTPDDYRQELERRSRT